MKISNDIAFVHMDRVKNPDNLVVIADFFMKLDEVSWSVVSGIYNKALIIIFRNSGLGSNAGKIAERLFGGRGGSAGGHKEAARVELPLAGIEEHGKKKTDYADFVRRQLVSIIHT